jgi:predicted DsbA family dithiol-disulfide isomerase
MAIEKTIVLNIEIVSDVVCPWCFIGKRRMEKALKLVSQPFDLKLSWKPFELNPLLPKEGVGYNEYLVEKFGDSDEVKELQGHVQQAAASADLHFEFNRIKRLPNTFDAHRLIWFAGQAGFQDQIVERLFRAVFFEGKFIGDLAVLAETALSAGLNYSEVKRFLDSREGREEVRSEIELSLKRGVQGVPNFLINGHYVIRGAQPPEVMAQILERASRESA